MKKQNKPLTKSDKLRVLLKSKKFAKVFLGFAIVVLFSTTLLWALNSAHLQQANADQLVGGYLFENHKTFSQAIFPAQHSFLIKWPLFFALQLFHFSNAAFIGLTLLVTALSVGLFAYILHRFEKRPLQLGLLLLMMSSVLLLVPAQPGPGGLLPVNMTMIATRNLEYILYVVCILGLAGAVSLKTKQFWLSVLGLTLLMASDRFFVSIALVAGLLGLIAYFLRKKRVFVNFSIRFLITAALAMVSSTLLIVVINTSKFTHITGKNGTSPYQLVHSLHDFILGLIFGTLGLLTNFGANPGYASLTIKGSITSGLHTLFSLGFLGYIVNLGILLLALYSAYQILAPTFRKGSKASKGTMQQKTAVMMVASTIAAAAAYVLTAHYYAGDARYLAIAFFAGFICLAQYSSKQKFEAETHGILIVVLILAICSGIFGSLAMSHQFTKNQAQLVARDRTIAHALASHKVDILAGDYWRVLPVRQQSPQTSVLPLEDCTISRTVLSSGNWQQNLTKHSFAYILSFDKPTPDFPVCSIDKLVQKYGRPNSSVVIAGTAKQPQELLLFYDKGAGARVANAKQPASTSILPITLDQVLLKDCPTGETTMNIVAHQDDDLLFMNPDIVRNLQAGGCNRTVYLTAGDAGATLQWLKREQGSEAAYAQMLGIKDPFWIERTIEVGKNQYVKVARLRGDSRVSLLFIHLPDGNIHGEGFKGTGHKSLAKLGSGSLAQLRSIDGQSLYTKNQLVDTLIKLLQTYQPTVIRTQSTMQSSSYGDHSDHQSTSDFATQAFQKYKTTKGAAQPGVLLSHYVGYPVRDHSENIFGDDLVIKESAFFAYAKFDDSVCGSVNQCDHTPTYNAYLKHQVTSSY